jgi:hypothetical protein
MSADSPRFVSRASVREPSVSPHETREFTNAVEYTIQLTFVVAGGARWRTAHGRTRPCRCAYRRPQEHREGRAEAHEAWAAERRCPYGRASTQAAFGCRPHRGQQLVVLDGDPPQLTRLDARNARPRAPDRTQPPPRRDDPGLPPPGR